MQIFVLHFEAFREVSKTPKAPQLRCTSISNRLSHLLDSSGLEQQQVEGPGQKCYEQSSLIK